MIIDDKIVIANKCGLIERFGCARLREWNNKPVLWRRNEQTDKDAKEERKREKGSLEEEQSIHSLHSADSNGFRRNKLINYPTNRDDWLHQGFVTWPIPSRVDDFRVGYFFIKIHLDTLKNEAFLLFWLNFFILPNNIVINSSRFRIEIIENGISRVLTRYSQNK